ncbi:2-amino-4-hydroxy-6-hydroxymethyldihydropteridinepyrophosphokinase [Achromobacter spanius]|uniref:2-amino-4-hydroxy-6- hydroxymethyldihydropteridine diphosphokinase n=1 Tax=Achromobacter spanius TaxID=217203 RepID=UPI000C2B5784|nr:2-amino-4-hydroxy-6-hydroxymethyldihydropteridine diphosphokinase [Achromobacter spanius]AUA54881.1 2-amino-4-hydroxy-6-hydroxymethyldihydropteridine diphosphokinase [Achromobacter spanius]CAB3636429.1 2-amino-4-hydroxy-6-hydroxymethyldihydropteridinepyrophosphokinase [Achromobacter spanius]SPT38006.1 2-amino-4-hydroxy-6-hydroxymethyldihydropteridinepyrophosphokinase [Achromobacter denitrificans]VEE57699.1 2-amino-4-hydroxy-6-hydroxymethyldihydropteridinepyrophosphokinase [Achromobacter span
MSPRLVRAYIGLGANLGDSAATLRGVLAELQASDGIKAVTASPFYRSAPVEATGPDFVNAVAALNTSLSPLALLDTLQGLENLHGRQRPYRNAPRTLDLDVLTYGDLAVNQERLTLPHPRMHQRAFVLLPLRDLAPDMVVLGRPISAWVDEIRDQAIERMPA